MPKEHEMIDSIVARVKDTTRPAIANVRKAQGELEALLLSTLTKFESATGFQVRYINISRKPTAKDKKSSGSDSICSASYYGGAIDSVTFDISIKKG